MLMMLVGRGSCCKDLNADAHVSGAVGAAVATDAHDAGVVGLSEGSVNS